MIYKKRTSSAWLRLVASSTAFCHLALIASGLFLSSLLSHGAASLTVNGSTSITVNAGDDLTFAWSASSDVQILQRGWGEASGTSLPLLGTETVRASNPSVTTTYTYTILAYNGVLPTPSASVQVTVVPGVVTPPYSPIVWQPVLPNYQLQTLSFYVLPDAVIGVPYFTTFGAIGKEPMTYGEVDLPDGLSIVGNTISGIPAPSALLQGGNFTLTATDADGYTSATLARMMTPVLEPRNLPAVTAPVVFDGGVANLDGAYVNDAGFNLERAASGFMLKAPANVTTVRVWGVYLGGFDSSPDDFTVSFYNRGPSPFGDTWASFPSAGSLLATFKPLSVVRAKTGRAAFGSPDSEFVYDIGFSGIALQANTLYYVCVFNNTSGRSWGWLTSTIQNYPSWGAWSQNGGVSFPGGSFELAFQLVEGPIAPVTPPSPTSPATYKLDLRRNGKGTVTFTPTGSSSSGTVFAAGTVVTVTATPDPKDKSSVWKGWTGDVVSSSRTITVTMSRNVTLSANFR